MSETTMRYCDVCAKCIGGDQVRYDISKWDQHGWVGVFDICSTACLAVTATRDAEDFGVAMEAEAVRFKLAGAPKRVRKWWQR